MRFHRTALRTMAAPVLALALGAAIAACSSSTTTSSGSSSPPANSASSSATASASATATASSSSGSSASAQITANWEKFFNASTPTAQRVALLQNGTAFSSAISGLIHLVSGLGSTVTNVTVNSATSATVTYNLTANGSSLLKGETGKAVYENGVWKVGDATLCGLVKLVPGGTVPAACSSAG